MEDRKGGFPHSEMSGSKGARASPDLIAACHVLLRLSMPRHPSGALIRLIDTQRTSCAATSRQPDGPPDTSQRQGLVTRCHTMFFIQVGPKSAGDAGQTLPSRCQSPPTHAGGGETCSQRSLPRQPGCAGCEPVPKNRRAGGARRSRTDDLMLAKHALYQLSYGPALASAGRPGQIRTADLTLIRGAL